MIIPERLLVETISYANFTFPIVPPFIFSDPNQLYIKVLCLLNQGGSCICGSSEGEDFELHHALITKRDVMGMSKDKRDLIHDTRNCVVLHHACHETATRRECYGFLVRIFDQEIVLDYYNSVKFKSTFRRIDI